MYGSLTTVSLGPSQWERIRGESGRGSGGQPAFPRRFTSAGHESSGVPDPTCTPMSVRGSVPHHTDLHAHVRPWLRAPPHRAPRPQMARTHAGALSMEPKAHAIEPAGGGFRQRAVAWTSSSRDSDASEPLFLLDPGRGRAHRHRLIEFVPAESPRSRRKNHPSRPGKAPTRRPPPQPLPPAESYS
jgi:hypothetical protein